MLSNFFLCLKICAGQSNPLSLLLDYMTNLLVNYWFSGGHIFILMNEKYFTEAPEYSRNLEPRMLQLQEEGLWKRVLKKTKIQNLQNEHTGVLFVLQKC